MKILHAIFSRGFYGSERYCIELALDQARSGHDVVILLTDAKSDCAHAFRSEISALNLEKDEREQTVQIRLSVMPGWLPRWLHRGFARGLLARHKPDIVHSHLNSATRRVGAVARSLAIPHVTTLHIDYDAHEHAMCDGLIAINDWQTERMPARIRNKATVVRPWLPRSLEAALVKTTAEDVAKLRWQWKVDDSTCVFGSVGRLEREKGMDVLIQAFHTAFPNRGHPVALVIVGDGSERRKLEELKMDDSRIIFAGAQSDVARIYRAIDVFVSAARFEPFGIAIMEAMAAGLPLVLTRTDGPQAFVPQSRANWAEPGDETKLAQQLTEVSAHGRRRCEYDLASLSQQRATALIEDFYRKVLSMAE